MIKSIKIPVFSCRMFIHPACVLAFVRSFTHMWCAVRRYVHCFVIHALGYRYCQLYYPAPDPAPILCESQRIKVADEGGWLDLFLQQTRHYFKQIHKCEVFWMLRIFNHGEKIYIPQVLPQYLIVMGWGISISYRVPKVLCALSFFLSRADHKG